MSNPSVSGQRAKKFLWDAVRSGDSDKVARILLPLHGAPGAPWDSKEWLFSPDSSLSPRKNNLLHVAVKSGDNTTLVHLLHNFGCGDSINAQNEDGNTPVHLIAKKDRLDLFQRVLFFSCVRPLVKKNNKGRTPLHHVALLDTKQPRLSTSMLKAWAIKDNKGCLAEKYAKETGKDDLYFYLENMRSGNMK